MRDERHLSEEVLNMYLDGELSTGERDPVEAHLAACEECRAEVLALQRLFAALEELVPAPAPDLVPGVLARVRPRRILSSLGQGRPRPLWLIPTLQAATALALLTWGWTRLADYWLVVVDALSPGTLREVWVKTWGWATAQWAALSAWPRTIGDAVREWSAWTSGFGGLHLSLAQLAVLGAALAALWLLGNGVLLRHALLNGQVIQKEVAK